MKKAIITALIAIIGIIVVLSLTTTKVMNVQNIEENDRNIDSFHEYSPAIYTIAGILMVISAFFTYRFHIIAGIIPFGLGLTLAGYGAYLLSIQFGLI